MRALILRKLFSRVLLLFLVSVVAHLLVHLAPGAPSDVDPTLFRMKPEDITKLRQAFHLDEPLHTQYLHWLQDLVGGELRSFRSGEPVLSVIGQRFLNSLPLFVLTTLIVWTVSFPIGIRAALYPRSAFDRGTTALAYGLISIPSFFLAYVVLALVSGKAGLPVLGTHTFLGDAAGGVRTAADRFWHLVIPALVSAAGGVAVLSRYARAKVAEVSEAEYLLAARARGVPEASVIYHHALRNALLPFITLFGFMLPSLVGGSVIVEQIFAWPGIGRLGYDAMQARDYPVLLTLNFFAAALTLGGLTLADGLYAVADPRVRRG